MHLLEDLMKRPKKRGKHYWQQREEQPRMQRPIELPEQTEKEESYNKRKTEIPLIVKMNNGLTICQKDF